jgi:hypothetical protein
MRAWCVRLVCGSCEVLCDSFVRIFTFARNYSYNHLLAPFRCKCICCDIRYECPINVKVTALGSLSGQFDFLPLGPFITQIA